MFHSIIFLLLSTSQYGPIQAHNDSLYIYTVYTESAKVFETSTQPAEWKSLSDSVTQVTAAAFIRLNKYNNANYAPVNELNREALGVALVFPKPVEMAGISIEPKAETKETANTNVIQKEIAFKVLDEQTHFLIGANGKGRTPYVVMNYYAKGRILVRSEKLNPVTHEPIKTEQLPLTASSN